MRSTFIAVFCLVMILAASSRSYAGAEVNAGGSFGDNTQHQHNTGAVFATAFKSDVAAEGNTWEAFALVNGTSLHADAKASRPNQVESSGASSGATATWSDFLTIGNPDLVTHQAFIHFDPRAHGHASQFAEANFTVALADPINGIVFDEGGKSVTGPSSTTMKFKLVEPLSYFFAPVSFYMSLNVTATARDRGDSAEAAYDHTAYLPPLYISDINGNPMPELAGLQIVGSSGIVYPVTTVQKVPGDYNGNGTVDAADYVVWRKSVGQTGSNLAADGDGNQSVDDYDLEVWRDSLGDTFVNGAGAGVSVAVPEPHSAFTLMIAAVLVTGFRRHRHTAAVGITTTA